MGKVGRSELASKISPLKSYGKLYALLSTILSFSKKTEKLKRPNLPSCRSFPDSLPSATVLELNVPFSSLNILINDYRDLLVTVRSWPC